ncbi:MAG: hypothetical protein H7Y02_03155 [Candidatus Obscuribacterales bacterium]|nr:hypothetical protein [Steroidobacteraceae bacterium]
MSSMINMARASAEAGGRDRFECSSDAWSLLLEVGKAFGWKPHGTTYVSLTTANLSDTVVLHDYQPGDSRDRKCVDADDAKSWAKALGVARGSSHLAAMVNARAGGTVVSDDSQTINPATATVMDEFIAYTFGGAFTFARTE